MKKSFMDPRRVLKAFGAVIVGVIAYCVLVAPLVKEGSYSDVVRDTLASVGVGILCRYRGRWRPVAGGYRGDQPS